MSKKHDYCDPRPHCGLSILPNTPTSTALRPTLFHVADRAVHVERAGWHPIVLNASRHLRKRVQGASVGHRPCVVFIDMLCARCCPRSRRLWLKQKEPSILPSIHAPHPQSPPRLDASGQGLQKDRFAAPRRSQQQCQPALWTVKEIWSRPGTHLGRHRPRRAARGTDDIDRTPPTHTRTRQ